MLLQATFPIMKTLNEVRTLCIIHSGNDIVNFYIPALYRHPGKTGSHKIKILQIVNIPMSFAHSGISPRSCKNFFHFQVTDVKGAIDRRKSQTRLK